jgi:hypothetical protein
LAFQLDHFFKRVISEPPAAQEVSRDTIGILSILEKIRSTVSADTMMRTSEKDPTVRKRMKNGQPSPAACQHHFFSNKMLGQISLLAITHSRDNIFHHCHRQHLVQNQLGLPSGLDCRQWHAMKIFQGGLHKDELL